jgi:hypothetical protein
MNLNLLDPKLIALVLTCPHFPHTGSYDVLAFCF